MELVLGKELFDKIVERGQYSERDASNIVRQIVAAVDYLHSNGIAHRDLKPENLLSAGDNDKEVIKIADFGFSKNFGEEKLMTSCGSPGYVAPEVLTSESYDKSVDMWSVGVIIYILLCGYPPFYADNAPALFKKIMDVKYDFDDASWDEVSDQAKNLIRHLLVKDPKERYTAKQCLDDPWVQGINVSDKMLSVKEIKKQ
jgi:calcium/calmodulin-dependent protein kinase I